MSLNTLQTAVADWLAGILTIVGRASGPKGHALYLDNNAGDFAFTHAPLVTEKAFVDTPADIDAAMGDTQPFVDIRTNERYEWDGTTWTQTPATGDDVPQPGRLYFSTVTAKVFFCAMNGDIHRITR